MHNDSDFLLTIKPVGYLRSQMRLKFDAPHQPNLVQQNINYIELIAGLGYERALRDLSGFTHIWLIWGFSKNKSWRPLVLPPRGPAVRRGVFATRSPHRPNALGISAVKLMAISELTLTIGECDLIDGTPIYDIKPYTKDVDNFPDAGRGWLSEVDSWLADQKFQVVLTSQAEEQRKWLLNVWGINFLTRAIEILERDPSVHRTRRIRRVDENLFRMSCGAWRLYFKLENSRVEIQSIEAGYPERLLLDDQYDQVPDRQAQLAFCKIWTQPINLL